MSVFTVHTIVQRDGMPVAFAPGDELPEWAVGKVGAHCLDADRPAAKSRPVKDEPTKDAEPAPPKSTEALDFTSAAPRRSKPRR